MPTMGAATMALGGPAVALVFLLAPASSVVALPSVPTVVTVDAGAGPFPPFEHFWKRTFGSGHAKLTLRPDWQEHLKSARDEIGLKGVRYHGIFDDDMGVVIAPRTYNFTLIDQSWDYQIGLGLTPVVELSFMPAWLANCTWKLPDPGGPTVNPGQEKCRTIMHYGGVTEHPTDFDDWAHLVHALGQHAVQRYGVANVSNWNWEVWNEMWGMSFPEPYMTLFNASSAALKAVHPGLRVGGPATMQLLDVGDFIQACAEKNIPYDFVSTHMYPTDPQCSRDPQSWSPNCFTDHVKQASVLAKTAGKPFYMTEYNVGCCPDTQSDTAGAAAFAFQEFGQLDGHTDILSWWTFTDVFEEGGLPKSEFENTFGMKTLHGVPKPAWRAFQLAHEHAGTKRVPVEVVERSPPAPPRPPPPPPPPPGTCSVMEGTDIMGNDILPDSDHLMLPNAQACCAACFNHTTPLQCSSWTYGLPGSGKEIQGRCYLKTSAARHSKNAHFTSGTTGIAPNPISNYTGPAISAFATTTASAGEGTVASGDLAVFLGFWSNGYGPTSFSLNRTVTLVVKGSALASTATEYRIDATHANPRAAWVEMGSPAVPSEAQIATLVAASEVTAAPLAIVRDPSTGGGQQQVTVEMQANSAVMVLFSS